MTATVTDPAGNTSEFSQCVQVTSAAAGSLQFSQPGTTVNETAGNATITVTRTGGSTGAVSVQYQTVLGGSATSNADYTPVSGTLSWASGDAASKTFIVPITNDNWYDGDEEIKLTLTNPTGGASLGVQSATTLTILEDEASPEISFGNVIQAEGNRGMTNFTFTVTLSTASAQLIKVDYSATGNTADMGADFGSTGGQLLFNPGETSKTITVAVVGDTTPEPDEEFLIIFSGLSSGVHFVGEKFASGKIIDDDTPGAPTFQFSSAGYSVQEDLTAVNITVTRAGDTSATATVDYATSDGTASQKGDYELATGTLTFAVGESTKTFAVLINEDSYAEGTESINLTLSNAGGATLGSQSNAVLSINDDSPESVTNPNDDAQNFVYQQYHDLLNREPDAGGLAYWTGQITQCGNDQSCINTKRKDISAAFYVELEFQETGYFVYRIQKASYGTQPTYLQFMADRSRIPAGPQIEQGKQAFADTWAQRAAFKAAYPDAMPQDQFVNKLYDTAGLVGYATERLQATQDLLNNVKTRAQVLREIIETPQFKTQEYNSSFVLMQYFGYLRREPDQAGYQFWLNVLNNQMPENQNGYWAMVCAFVTSAEYQDRFSMLHSHSNGECGQ